MVSTCQILTQVVQGGGSVFNSVSTYPLEGGYMYVTPVGYPTLVYQFGQTSSGLPSFTLVAQTDESSAGRVGVGSATITTLGKSRFPGRLALVHRDTVDMSRVESLRTEQSNFTDFSCHRWAAWHWVSLSPNIISHHIFFSHSEIGTENHVQHLVGDRPRCWYQSIQCSPGQWQDDPHYCSRKPIRQQVPEACLWRWSLLPVNVQRQHTCKH